MEEPITIAHYLFSRLRQLGVVAVHGVPGDYNLVSLDYLEGAGLQWVGDANELNAGYSADGYARVKGVGAIMTTFGVGELSAINAIAGAYAEYVPVVHIAGSPSTTSQKDHKLLHHTLGNGDFKVFARMYKEVTIAQANLDDITTAADEIADVLRKCWLLSRPVYIELPTDLVTKTIDGKRLQTLIDLSFPMYDEFTINQVSTQILHKIYAARRPVILVDGCVARHHCAVEAVNFVNRTQLPTFTSPMGKGTIDESLPNFGGVYAGSGSHDNVREFVENSDLVIALGSIKSDFNTTGFTYHLSELSTIDLHSQFVEFDGQKYEVGMRALLQSLTDEIDTAKIKKTSFKDIISRSALNEIVNNNYPQEAICHDYLWVQLSKWLKPDDILITETGTSYLGVWDTKLPSGALAISQTLWGSIGYTLPAAQGAALATRELGRPGRVILFEGDGSSQLTVQAIGTMLKLNLDIIIFLINNDGYTIERYVHGMKASYNDIPGWKYAMLPEVMGGKMGTNGNARSYQVRTKSELEALWMNEQFANGKGMRFVELFMPWDDAPLTLKMTCAAAAKTNEAH